MDPRCVELNDFIYNLNSIGRRCIPILKALLDSSLLDAETEYKDCVEVFSDYEWVMVEGGDREKFHMLRKKGVAGELSFFEMVEFMKLVSYKGETHIFYYICRGNDIIKEYTGLMPIDLN